MLQHKQVSVDFTNHGGDIYDLAVPIYLPLNELIPLLMESLDIQTVFKPDKVKITTKSILLKENDRLVDFQVSNGDILKLL